jgi:broad specificity polyphosphatase/5'/3'-nucleotidase SurE
MEESLDIPAVNIQQIRADYFKELASEHNLTIEEIQKIHKDTLAKLTKTESKGAMFMNIAFPAAIKNYKEKRE